MKFDAIVFTVLILASACAQADAPLSEATESVESKEQIAEVAVTGTKNPALKPYRIMSAGMDAFDEYHQLAPAALLKFKLKKRTETSARKSNWDQVSLRVAGNETSILIQIAPDGTFTLPRNQQAYDEDADLILNQKKSSIGFVPDVRTPGLASDVWRLGDLRLQCHVAMGIGKKELNFAMRAALERDLSGWKLVRSGHWAL